MNTGKCSICGSALKDGEFARSYPGFVCRKCDARAVNEQGEPARHAGEFPEFQAEAQSHYEREGALLMPPDGGDNPVFIDGKKCWRRYRFGGWVTMLDTYDCRDISEFYDRASQAGPATDPHARQRHRSFLERERERQASLKHDPSLFTKEARGDGHYRGKPRTFCLPAERAGENLFHGIRSAAISCFKELKIKWHDGKGDLPSNHLCSSQVCCVNFLYPFSENPQALLELMRPLYPDMARPLPLEGDRFLSFEWIGQENYLREKTRGERTRGANVTSADAAFMYEDTSARRSIVLIEWKYTESYPGVDLHFSKSGTDRTEIYRWLWEQPDCPLARGRVDRFEDLFFEPFYQLMRLQFLAWRMGEAGELGAQRGSVLHIAPRKNEKFQSVTSPGLRSVGESVKEIWDKLQVSPGCFRSVCTEDLFGGFDARPSGLEQWQKYVSRRYELR